MKVTFPYMGTTVVYKKLLEMLGHDVILPPKPTRKTIDIGVKYSPEFACFPLKVIMGSYFEAIQEGAEVIVTSGGNGPCREGFMREYIKEYSNLKGMIQTLLFLILCSGIHKHFIEILRD